MIGVPRVISAPAQRVILGEGPVWDERAGTLYWVDVERGNLHQCKSDGSEPQVICVGERLGCVALRDRHDGLIAGLEHRIGFLALNPLSIETLAAPESEKISNRSNDGKCDPFGRFWLGTLEKAGQVASGWLYRIDPDGRVTRAAGPFICTNGPEISVDGKTLYCVDSYGKTIYRYALNKAAGELSDQRVFVRFEDPTWGLPDGLTTDREGCLWVAHWAGSRVSRFGPNGELLDVIALPVSQVTSCTFGGEELKTLFITSASIGLQTSEAPESLAGALFAVDLDVGGVAANRFGG
jgi:xylono-1,5-lactonase